MILKKKLNSKGTARSLPMIPRDLKRESRQRWMLFGNSSIVVHGQKTSIRNCIWCGSSCSFFSLWTNSVELSQVLHGDEFSAHPASGEGFFFDGFDR